MAVLPERWEVLQTGDSDPASGRPYRQISRKQGQFITVWKLSEYGGNWKVESLFTSNQSVTSFPNGLRLTVSRIDTILLSLAEGQGFPEGA